MIKKEQLTVKGTKLRSAATKKRTMDRRVKRGRREAGDARAKSGRREAWARGRGSRDAGREAEGAISDGDTVTQNVSKMGWILDGLS
jgi:hypothetical protein